jgi:hypothetical protein
MRGQVHYLRSDPRPKKPTCSSGANCPCLYIFRITPHEITEWPFMWNLTIPFNYSYLPCDREKKCISTNHEEKKQQEIIVQHTAPQWRLPLSTLCIAEMHSSSAKLLQRKEKHLIDSSDVRRKTTMDAKHLED